MKQGTRFKLDGTLYEVVQVEHYGRGTWISSRRVNEPMAPLFQHGIGTLQFYRNNGRLVICEG